jgi:hypothetical protein
MKVTDAQREVRTVYSRGAIGQAVSGALWLASAACGTWLGVRQGVLVLVLGGAMIFPIMQLVLRLMGRRASLSRENPLTGLAMQVAFTVPLAIPVILGATLHKVHWFYPAFMVIVGAHYLPFVFLYGLWQYAVLGGLLVAGGVMLGLYGPPVFAVGGWCTGAVLVLFSLWFAALRERPEAASA